MYGDPKVHPQPENYWGNVNPIGPRSCYDEGKRCAETLFFDYRRQHDLPIKVARIFNTYGPRMRPDDGRVVSNFIVAALRGEPHHDLRRRLADPLVLLRRRPRRRPDRADELAARGHRPDQPRQPGRVHDARTGRRRCSSSSAAPATIDYQPLPADDPTRRKPDIDQARAVLGWSPTVELDEGLARTVDYFSRELTPESVAQLG